MEPGDLEPAPGGTHQLRFVRVLADLVARQTPQLFHCFKGIVRIEQLPEPPAYHVHQLEPCDVKGITVGQTDAPLPVLGQNHHLRGIQQAGDETTLLLQILHAQLQRLGTLLHLAVERLQLGGEIDGGAIQVIGLIFRSAAPFMTLEALSYLVEAVMCQQRQHLCGAL